jgi:Cu2+-containing amine oxidase
MPASFTHRCQHHRRRAGGLNVYGHPGHGLGRRAFLGVAIYVAGQEVVLVSEMQAGWYRYVSEWRLHSNGTIRPRFGFDATSSSCVCNRHHHHVYWRLDFDIETAGNNLIREFNNPPISPGTNWHTKPYEIRRLRSPAHNRRWRVENASSGRGYTIVPGQGDGTAAGDSYAKGDLWFLRYHPGEIDDHPITATEIQIDKYKNGEPLVNRDVVVWYGAHFTHDPSGPHVSHVVGPNLHPHEW